MKEIDELKLLLKASKDEDEDEDVEEPTLFDVDEDDEEDKKEMRGRKGKGAKKKEEEEDEEGKYDAHYIKKFLKKYAKDNEEEFKKFCKDIGVLKKAVVDAAEDAETDEADAVLVEGTEMFKAFADFAEKTTEAIIDIKEKLNEMSEIVMGQAAITKASSDVLVKAAEMIASLEDSAGMYKGVVYHNSEEKGQKKLDITAIKSRLLKAAQEGDPKAFNAMTKVESCYGNLALVGADTISYIKKLMEAN